MLGQRMLCRYTSTCVLVTPWAFIGGMLYIYIYVTVSLYVTVCHSMSQYVTAARCCCMLSAGSMFTAHCISGIGVCEGSSSGHYPESSFTSLDVHFFFLDYCSIANVVHVLCLVGLELQIHADNVCLLCVCRTFELTDERFDEPPQLLHKTLVERHMDTHSFIVLPHGGTRQYAI